MGVNDIGTQAGHELTQLTPGSWVHGQLTGQVRGGAVDREAIVPLDAAAAIITNRCRGDDGGSWPASLRLWARSCTWVSMPPSLGA